MNTGCKLRVNARSVRLPKSEAHIANCFGAETLFKLSQDVELRNLLEFVVQNRLEHTDVENSVTQRERRRMCGDELTNDLGPGVDHFCLSA